MMTGVFAIIGFIAVVAVIAWAWTKSIHDNKGNK